MASQDSFGARSTLEVGDASYEVFRLDAVDGRRATSPTASRCCWRTCCAPRTAPTPPPTRSARSPQWDPTAEPDTEIQYTPARVLMQDFTGVPCIVDLATMREAMADLGGDPKRINPLAPAELVIDHSVIADHFGSKEALGLNSALEYDRNRERYEFLKWGQTAFEDFKVVPPETGIVHQVNLERLATVVFVPRRRQAYPDTLVGTDSHTTMINGLGVLGWGVGGIEAEAAMLGQPVSMLIPKVVGFKLTGELPAGATATDLVLTVTELLRKQGVVGKFVEFYGPGVSNVPLADRATIGNMSPEYGSTCAIFPDRRRDAGLPAPHRPSGRDRRARRGVRQGAGPVARPVGRAALLRAGRARPVDGRAVARRPEAPAGPRAARPTPRRCSARRWPTTPRPRRSSRTASPASRRRRAPPCTTTSTRPAPSPSRPPTRSPRGRRRPTTSRLPDNGKGDAVHDRPSQPRARRRSPAATRSSIDHGHVAIAAITSCTNTSNPYVMVGAGLLAKNAVEKGLTSKPWVKTTLAPGSKVVTDYYEKAGLHARTSTSSASRPSATAARPASATAARCPRRSAPRSTRATSRSCRCSPATATSRAASTPTSR